MSSSVLLPGTLFAGRYRVEKCIAEGGMGAVYEVLHAETGRRHALKIMHAHTLGSAELRDRFRREARVAANIQSEFIVDVFDAGVDTATNLPFLVMELLQGEELGRLLAARGRFTAGETVLFLGQVAMALDKTHRAMIVHRDLKPENLFLTQRDDGSPRVKVLDFGVAKIVAETSTNAAATRSLGTPLYMAPEQFQPGNRVSPATDLFALAMIAYTFLVGASYWTEEANEAANVFSFGMTAIRGPQESACARAARAGVSLPRAFDPWFARATHVDPSMRFPHANGLVRALAEALGVPSPLRPAGDPLAGSGSNPSFGDVLAGTGANPAAALAAPVSAPSATVPVGSGTAPHGVLRDSGTLPHGALRDSGTAAIPAAQAAVLRGAYSGALQTSVPDVEAATLAVPGAARGPMSVSSLQAPVLGASAALTASGPPTVVGTTGGLAGADKPPSSGASRLVIAGAVGSLAIGFLVAAIFLIPRSDAGSGVGAGASATPTEAPTAIATTASIPTVTPAPPAPPEAPTTTATAAPTEAPTATATARPTGAKPPSKGPKPPGTSVYIRD